MKLFPNCMLRPVYIFFLTLTAILSACAKEDVNKTYNSQEESISNYISTNFSDNTLILRDGSSRVIIDSGYGADTLAFGDSLVFIYAGYVFSNGPSSIFATNSQSVAEKNKFTITVQEDTFMEHSVLFTRDCFTSGLTNGLCGVTEGEHSVILFSAKYGFGEKPVANVPGLSALIYEVWIEDVIKNQ